MDPDRTLETLAPVVRDLVLWLNERRVPFAIIGGIACALQGRARTTGDVDAVVIVPPEDWQSFLDAAAQFGFTPRLPNAIEFATESRVLLLAHASSGMTADVSFGALPFEEDLIKHAVHADFHGVDVPLARPEDLIIMKTLAGRSIDMGDIHHLLDANPHIDLVRVRQLVAGFAEGLEMPEIAERLEDLLAKRAMK